MKKLNSFDKSKTSAIIFFELLFQQKRLKKDFKINNDREKKTKKNAKKRLCNNQKQIIKNAKRFTKI